MMEGKRRLVNHDDWGEIKKGPWKPEEDEVLINHVNKYGPRDWSSIRSKGLLQRAGKSCRLRWVNKLRPDLKNGVKFSAEEERTVIDLQAQFGNKWARIATYLKGRTDNDVKNFWSSRQKRLARILQTSTPSANKTHKSFKQARAPSFLDVSPIEAPQFSSSSEEETLTMSLPCPSSHIDDSEAMKMVPLPELEYSSSRTYEHNDLIDYTTPETKLFAEPKLHLSFPQIPQLQPDFPLPLDSQDLIRLGDSNFLDVFGNSRESALGTAQLPIMSSHFEPDKSCQISGKEESNNSKAADIYIDDFPPMDMFDDIVPLPSSLEWP